MSEYDEHPMCIFCKHFTVKIMLNGYNGICEKHGAFVRFKEYCKDWEKRETEQHDQS